MEAAIDAYAEERRAQVSPRMVAYWKENARPLAAFFGTTRLRNLTPGHLAAYQNAALIPTAPRRRSTENCQFCGKC